MSRKEDCWAGIEGLIEKTQENINIVLNHYGFDSYERKVKFLEEELGVSSVPGVDNRARFAVLCQYIKERVTNTKPKQKANTLDELAKKAKVKVVNVPSGLSKDSIAEFIRNQLKEQEEEPAEDKSEVNEITSEIANMISDFSAEEQHRIYATIKKLHEKYERTPEERAFETACEELGIEPCQEAWALFIRGVNLRG